MAAKVNADSRDSLAHRDGVTVAKEEHVYMFSFYKLTHVT